MHLIGGVGSGHSSDTLRHQLLAAESGLYRHDQHHIRQLQIGAHRICGSRRLDGNARLFPKAMVIQTLRRHTGLFFDVHLMIEKPERYLQEFADCGADLINFQQKTDSKDLFAT